MGKLKIYEHIKRLLKPVRTRNLNVIQTGAATINELKDFIDNQLALLKIPDENKINWAKENIQKHGIDLVVLIKTEIVRIDSQVLNTNVYSNIQLVLEGYRSYNIVYCNGVYFAWPQQSGPFAPELFTSEKQAVIGLSIKQAKALIDLGIGYPDMIEESNHDWNTVFSLETLYENDYQVQEAVRSGSQINLGMPTFVIASTAFGCNLRCTMCYLEGEHELAYDLGAAGRRNMSDEVFDKVLEILPTTETLLMTVEGEILIYRNWFDRWLESAQKHPHLKLGFQTNGMTLDAKIIQQILDTPAIVFVGVSIDGASDTVNDSIRLNSSLKRIIQNMRSLIEERNKKGKSKPEVHTHFVMMRENIHELPEFVSRMIQLGVDRISACHLIARRREDIKEALFFDQERSDQYLNEAISIATSLGKIDKVHLPEPFSSANAAASSKRLPCYDPWKHGQILHDGSVYSCCNNAVKMGNVLDDGGYKQVWNNEKYQDLRRVINSDDPVYTACKYCYALLPVNNFEAFIDTTLLFKLLGEGEEILQQWCPTPVQLMVRSGEKWVG